MDGENHGSKPYFLMDDWGGTIIFGNTHFFLRRIDVFFFCFCFQMVETSHTREFGDLQTSQIFAQVTSRTFGVFFCDQIPDFDD